MSDDSVYIVCLTVLVLALLAALIYVGTVAS